MILILFKKGNLMLIDSTSHELVETAKCSIYSELENPEDFLGNLLKLINLNPDEWNKIGKKGINLKKRILTVLS